jgi:choline kinase
VNRIFVIGGYNFPVLKKHLDSRKDVYLIDNKDYRAGSVLTLEKAIPFLKDSFLLMNVDHIYPPEMFEKIAQNTDPDSIVAMVDSDRELGDDDMKVRLNEEGNIERISKQLDEFDVGYIGMTFVGKNRAGQYKNGLEKVRVETRGRANVEAILDFLCNLIPVKVLDLSGFGWHEVDTPEERAKAEKALG